MTALVANVLLDAWQQAPATVLLAVTGIAPLVVFIRRRAAAVSAVGLEPPEKGLALALVYFVLYMACGALALGVSTGLFFAILAGALFAVAGAAWFLRRRERPRGSPGRRLATGLAVLWAALPVVYGVFVVVALVWPQLEPQQAVVRIRERRGDWIRLTVVVVLLAPLFEELVFRGFLQASLRQLWSPLIARVAAAFGFAIIHEPSAMLPMFFFGYAMGIIRDRTGAVGPCVVAHVVFNVLTVGQLLLLPGQPGGNG